MHEERRERHFRISRSFVAEDTRLYPQNDCMKPQAKEEFVADSIASSPGWVPLPVRRCTLAAEAPGSSGCKSFRCNVIVSVMLRHYLAPASN